MKISYDDLKKKVNEIGPAYVFLEGEGKIIKIDFPYPGGLFNPLNWLGVVVDYEDALGNIKRIKKNKKE